LQDVISKAKNIATSIIKLNEVVIIPAHAYFSICASSSVKEEKDTRK